MNENANRYRVQALLVRSFFTAFFEAIFKTEKVDHYIARTVKACVVKHYENVAPAFTEVMYPILTVLHYENQAEAQQRFMSNAKLGKLDVQTIFQTACKDDAVYEDMKMLYQYYLSALIQGQMPTSEEHITCYTHNEEHSACNEETALRLFVRTIYQAYCAGLRTTQQQWDEDMLVSVYELILSDVSLFADDTPLKSYHLEGVNDLKTAFVKVAGSEAHYVVINDELQKVMQKAIEEEQV